MSVLVPSNSKSAFSPIGSTVSVTLVSSTGH